MWSISNPIIIMIITVESGIRARCWGWRRRQRNRGRHQVCCPRVRGEKAGCWEEGSGNWAETSWLSHEDSSPGDGAGWGQKTERFCCQWPPGEMHSLIIVYNVDNETKYLQSFMTILFTCRPTNYSNCRIILREIMFQTWLLLMFHKALISFFFRIWVGNPPSRHLPQPARLLMLLGKNLHVNKKKGKRSFILI